MKKMKLFLLAAVLVAAGSAFTIAPKVTLGSYYRDGDTIVPRTTDGFCDPGSDFCTYDLIPGHADNGDPANYEGVGTEDKQWVPTP